MSVILQNTPSVHASIFGLLRYVELPNTRSVAPRISALIRAYSRLVGKELPYPEAIRVLDRIIAERDDVPFPREFSAIADYLIRSEFDIDAVHEIVGHLARGGSVANCDLIAPADRAAILDLMPRQRTSPNYRNSPCGADWEADSDDCGCGR